MKTVTGPFEVEMKPLELEDVKSDAHTLNRFHLDKSYQGALEAAGKGQMISCRTATEGSAGYVAIEHVDGKLDGKSGTFVLQHSGVMDRGSPSLFLAVVPDSGTGELAGLKGTMEVDVSDGHAYSFSYSLDD